MLEQFARRKAQKKVFKEAVAELTGSKLAGYKNREFSLATPDGDKVVETTIWRKGVSRRITYANVEIRDKEPRWDDGERESYDFTRISVHGGFEYMQSGRHVAEKGSQGWQIVPNLPSEQFSDGTLNLDRMVGKTVSMDDAYGATTELLGTIDKRKDKIGKTRRKLL